MTNSGLVVWNPYLGQTKWIQPRNSYHKWDRYALGYETNKNYSKVLRFFNNHDPNVNHRICEFEIYSNSSWKVLVDINLDWAISFNHRGLSLKGNTYWYARQKIDLDGPPPVIRDLPGFLLSFDFTTESFGPLLPLPFLAFFGDTVTLSSVREEQLAVLFQKSGVPGYTVKIWISTKIEPNAVSWGSSLFLAVDMKPLTGFRASSFFVDEEKNVAVVLDKDRSKSRNIAYIIGKNGYLKQVDLGESRNQFCYPLVCSYVPSSLQIQQPESLGNTLIY
ncbi:unnamed protein product [Arabidopsis lyrata]|uniref:F-box/kelch-repeat protein At3g16740 n=1 Tax=Arabidopsis lyrata subsp. lyrata TaxID=81972 RepID=UPI000A29B5AF|nr:F-box/kelch-repeat protein At3g16740 [Arabidopsis lyrata subsp. lyrata]CAH8273588.1 unnamed protein product [Arabidopsis lyrata]|eukprot:XP_020876181.1 F-box/kelch-repeat protein At3g16740 [Arabidopsis lyrata subsp. lyrata]